MGYINALKRGQAAVAQSQRHLYGYRSRRAILLFALLPKLLRLQDS